MDFTVHPLPDLSPICKVIASSEMVRLFEGLPHQSFEKELLARELAANEIVHFADFPFYEGQMELQEPEAMLLTESFSQTSTYEPHVPGKLCGGFHPDFAAEWIHPSGTVRVLICFGCRECLLFTNNVRLKSDINNEAYARLYESFSRLRKKRPEQINTFDPVLLRKVHELGIKAGTLQALEAANIYFVGDLIQRTRGELSQVSPISAEDIEEIVFALALMGLTLGTDLHNFSSGGSSR